MEQIRPRVAVHRNLARKLPYGSRGELHMPRVAPRRRRMYRRLPHLDPRFLLRLVPRIFHLRCRSQQRPPQCLRLRVLLFLPRQDRHLRILRLAGREAEARRVCRPLPHPGIARLRRLPNLSRREAFLLAHRRRLPCVRGQLLRVRLLLPRLCRRKGRARNLPCAPVAW